MRWKLTDNNREIFMFYVYMLVTGALILGFSYIRHVYSRSKFFWVTRSIGWVTHE